MTNPVFSILLRPDNFREVNEKMPSRGVKDFFTGNDEGFFVHKKKLLNSIDSISEELRTQFSGPIDSPIGFLKVSLKQEAWAKSYRPIHKLFKSSLTPLIGGDGIGEMIFEVNDGSLQMIREAIDKFEMKGDQIYPNPLRYRCEIGAIEQIKLWDKDDKYSFTPESAAKHLQNPATGGGYYVELFHELSLGPKYGIVDELRWKLHKSLISGFQELGLNICLFKLSNLIHGKTSILIAQLKKSTKQEKFEMINFSNMEELTIYFKSAQIDHNIESNVDKHKKFLEFIDLHPLIKRIQLPPLISRSEGIENSNDNSNPFVVSPPQKDQLDNCPKVGIIDGGVNKILGPWVQGCSNI